MCTFPICLFFNDDNYWIELLFNDYSIIQLLFNDIKSISWLYLDFFILIWQLNWFKYHLFYIISTLYLCYMQVICCVSQFFLHHLGPLQSSVLTLSFLSQIWKCLKTHTSMNHIFKKALFSNVNLLRGVLENVNMFSFIFS